MCLNNGSLSAPPPNIPADGTLATTDTLRREATNSQTSFPMEYFEGGKGQSIPTDGLFKCHVRLTSKRKELTYKIILRLQRLAVLTELTT
jgi:hypothetical protein